ncbi:hypothetical protein [Streptomyces sp. P17]|uniref:hypothetical protein n=1 Tax=Streptomyces sp. P17 TaxID=3074716 RepID=UPI0028F3E694|nr:hypothetical protein [Streptomyces sp. P17]MDT9700823.1 hypothetical protein [Streptomyces sp. P17]
MTNRTPISGALLATDARVLAAAHAIGARHGVDYTNDAAVTALFAERQRAMRATQRGWLAWMGGLTLTAGVILPVTATELPERTAKLALLGTGVLLMVAVTSLTALCVHWKRELTHPALSGYREVLGVARAHGLPLTHVPAWLEGRTSGGSGKGWAPIPTYPKVEAAPSRPADVAAKPAAVLRYEETADTGGWHDETGCLLLLAGLIGAGWAWSNEVPLAYGLLALIPLAIVVWMAGSRQGNEKQALRAEAEAYVRTVAAARAAGARGPELSPVLKKLLEEDE